MADGLYAAMSGAIARSMALDVVANNVANAPTPGYRADAMAFREVPAQPVGEPPRPDTDLRLTTLDAITPSWRPGPIEETGGTLDLAIEGDGLLAVRTAEGPRYVRGGTMVLDDEGTLMTATGYPLLDAEDRVVRIPLEQGTPIVAEDGTIRVGEQDIGQLQMVWFETPAALRREGDNLFSVAPGAEETEATGNIRQGFIERSNVNVVRGMIDLISLTRSYEATVRAMESFRTIDRRTARDLAHG